jgi:hypothetical protein
MERDFDLIRSILLQVESAPAGAPVCQLGIEEHISAATLIGHIGLMAEEGLIEARVLSASQCAFGIQRITWKGYDFLETAKNEDAWKRVMGVVKEKGLALTISVISGLLSKEALRLAGLG